jgi:hypothetical protein
MKMWSRGLGKENLSLEFDVATVRTLDEALETMPPPARERLLLGLNGSRGRCLAITGKISPPVGWEYVILLERKDVFKLFGKILTVKLFKLFL